MTILYAYANIDSVNHNRYVIIIYKIMVNKYQFLVLSYNILRKCKEGVERVFKQSEPCLQINNKTKLGNIV